MRLMILIVFFPLFIFCGSCKKLGLCKDEELNINRTEYSGKELRIDGFYYDEGGEPDSEGTVRHSIIILYHNGVGVFLGGTTFDNMEKYIGEIRNSDALDAKYVWGVFKVTTNIIEIERWVSTKGCLRVAYMKGSIKNDTIFTLTEGETRKGKRKDSIEIDATYHFRQHSPKPDSTQDFIK